MHMIIKTAFRIMICMLIINAASCAKQFEELDGSSFKRNWEISHLQSAVLWWYLGEKNKFHYFVKDSPLIQDNYRISKKYIDVVLDKPKEFTLDEGQWINLRITQIKFKD